MSQVVISQVSTRTRTQGLRRTVPALCPLSYWDPIFWLTFTHLDTRWHRYPSSSKLVIVLINPKPFAQNWTIEKTICLKFIIVLKSNITIDCYCITTEHQMLVTQCTYLPVDASDPVYIPACRAVAGANEATPV